jgi:type IV pilus assembly protein PilB
MINSLNAVNPLEAFAQEYAKQLLLSPEGQQPIPSDHELSTLQGFTALLAQPHVNHRWIAHTLSNILAIPWLDLDDFEPDKIPLEIISESLLRQHPLLPLWERHHQLYIGLAHPFHPEIIEAIRFYIAAPVSLILVEQPKLEDWRKKLLNNPALSLQELPKAATPVALSKTTTPLQSAASDSMDDPPLIRYVNQMLYHAVDQQASDIHFEPQTHHLQIRFRIDGVLYPQPAPPPTLSDRILSRLKIMAQLDIAEKRIPQDGRFSFTLPDNTKRIDCRVSTCPTFQGEKIAIRLLDSQKTTFEIESLGLNAKQYALFLTALKEPQGMILVTGPTGSGKTLTLYSGLYYLNQPTVNIASAEDPIEIYLPGVNQVNIQPKIGFDFAEALKVFLRQDPDIIMFGEIRDSKTAQIGIQAAQTGHLVLSTLHTNSAAETLTRLVNMGIPNYHITASVSLIIAQRLVRRLCVHCKKPHILTPEILAHRAIETKHAIQVYQAHGCKKCMQGYQGRIGIFELLPMTPTIADIMLQHNTAATIEKHARLEGMLTLKESALEKLQAGIIDLEAMDQVS